MRRSRPGGSGSPPGCRPGCPEQTYDCHCHSLDKAYLVIIFVIVLVVLLIVIELVILLVLLVVLVIVVLIIVVILISKQVVVELLQLELVRPGLGKGGFLRTHSLCQKKRDQLSNSLEK